MKKVSLFCSVLLFTAPVFAADVVRYTSPQVPIINSTTTTATNELFGVNTNGVWPCTLFAGTSCTNVTAFSVANSSQVTFQLNAQLNVAAGASVTNIIYHIGRSVQGQYPTNAIGTGCNIEWFATITNQLPASAAANTTYTQCATFGSQQGYGSGAFKGACPVFYLGWIDAPANMAITNYSVYVSTQ